MYSHDTFSYYIASHHHFPSIILSKETTYLLPNIQNMHILLQLNISHEFCSTLVSNYLDNIYEYGTIYSSMTFS